MEEDYNVIWVKDYRENGDPVLETVLYGDLALGDNYMEIAYDNRIYRKTEDEVDPVCVFCRDYEEAVRCL